MSDICNPSECPVNSRVDALEKRFDRFEDGAKSFHEDLGNRVKDQEKLAAVQDQKLDDIKDGQIDMMSKLNALMGKSGSRWDGTVDKVIWFVLEAILIVAAVKVGLR